MPDEPTARTVRRRSNRLALALALAWMLTALAVGTVMSADRQTDEASTAPAQPAQTAAVAASTPSPDESPLMVLALGAVAGTAAGVVTVRHRRSTARLRD